LNRQKLRLSLHDRLMTSRFVQIRKSAMGSLVVNNLTSVHRCEACSKEVTKLQVRKKKKTFSQVNPLKVYICLRQYQKSGITDLVLNS
jgi:hypothetical protein